MGQVDKEDMEGARMSIETSISGGYMMKDRKSEEETCLECLRQISPCGRERSEDPEEDAEEASVGNLHCCCCCSPETHIYIALVIKREGGRISPACVEG